ncbi:MAG: lipocalin-like domain-containing protein [Bradymonadia bacterium]
MPFGFPLFGGVPTSGTPMPPVALPRDEGPHREPVEWWYFVGHLPALGATPECAFEFTLFKAELFGAPPLVYAYFAFIERGGPYLSFDRLGGTLTPRGLWGFEARLVAQGEQPDTWRVIADLSTPTAPRYRLEAAFMVEGNRQRALRLDLTPSQTDDVLVPGDAGRIDLAGGPMCLYARPRLACLGGIKRDGALSGVTGEAWLDHQWGDARPLQAQWRYFAVRLRDGGALMVGEVEPTNGTAPARWALWSPAGGGPQTSVEFTVTPGATLSPSGYPLTHTIDCPGVPLLLTVTALGPDMRRVPTGGIGLPGLTLWEAACEVTDANGVVGWAFNEIGGRE